MKIPRKITPDNLKDSIVQLRFEPNCFPELFLGKFEMATEKQLKYIGGSIKQINKDQIVLGGNLSGYFVDFEEKVKITVSHDNITFNLLSKYPGWKQYSPIIKQITNDIIENNLIKNINRIGVRYISQYENFSIIDNLKLDINFFLNKSLSSSQFRTEFDYDRCRVILTILNSIRDPKNNSVSSIIDIDVIKYIEKNYTLEMILESIEDGHNKQNELFFSILQEKFLNTLNPEY